MIDKQKIESLIYELLIAIGEDPQRPGLKDTPHRVANMYEEIFSGLSQFPEDSLKTFKEEIQGDEFIIVKDIPFYSMCEHHLIPFFGTASVAYIPKEGEIIGISKIARIVNYYAKRPQVQEKMTRQISDFIFDRFNVLGVAVIIEAQHLCMTMRGIKSIGSKTKTSVLAGVIKTDRDKRDELYSLL